MQRLSVRKPPAICNWYPFRYRKRPCISRTFFHKKDLINMKDSQNFYVGVSKPRLSVLGCLEQYNLNETSNCVVFIFFQILRFEIGGAAYLRMRLIRLR